MKILKIAPGVMLRLPPWRAPSQSAETDRPAATIHGLTRVRALTRDGVHAPTGSLCARRPEQSSRHEKSWIAPPAIAGAACVHLAAEQAQPAYTWLQSRRSLRTLGC